MYRGELRIVGGMLDRREYRPAWLAAR
jgi:hypothetical protein